MRLTSQEISLRTKNTDRAIEMYGATECLEGMGDTLQDMRDMLDTISSLESELAEARAGCAALLEKVIRMYQESNGQNPEDQASEPDCFVDDVKALIGTDATAALAERDLRQHQRWILSGAMDVVNAVLEMLNYTPDDEAIGLGTVRVALAEEKRKARVEAFEQCRKLLVAQGSKQCAAGSRVIEMWRDDELRAEKGAKP